MKAITIWQPWAELVVLGFKHYETRSWATAYRGKIAIHAGKFHRLPHSVYADIAEAIGITLRTTTEAGWRQRRKGKA